jgi:hypothetical protein
MNWRSDRVRKSRHRDRLPDVAMNGFLTGLYGVSSVQASEAEDFHATLNAALD